MVPSVTEERPVVAPLHVSILGTPFRIEIEDEGSHQEVARLLEQFAEEPGNDSGAVSLRFSIVEKSAPDREIEIAGPFGHRTVANREAGLELLFSQLNQIALERCPHLAIHAAVVARNGRAVALPAASGTGKSTLTAACLRAGFDYVSDEALCLTWADATLVPYPRPIGLSTWSCAEVGLEPPTPPVQERLVSPGDLGASTAAVELQLTRIILLEAPEPAFRFEACSRTFAATELLRRSFNAWKDPQLAFALAHDIAARTTTWTLASGPPVETAHRLRELTEVR